MAQTIAFLPSASDGLVDEFGNGLIDNYVAEMFALPPGLADQPQSQWYIAQWGQPILINPTNYVQDDPSTADPNYGNAAYAWAKPGTSSAFAIYRNTTAPGGGDVYALTDANTTSAPDADGTDESDMFLSSPPVDNARLSHPIELSLDAKITQSLIQFGNPQMALDYATAGTVFGTFDIGMTVNFDGAGGLPDYSGFVQIVPWTSESAAAADYNNGALATDDPAAQFISSLLLPGDASLALLPSDAGAAPQVLTYDINKYVAAALATAFAKFSVSQQSSLFNLANWTLGSLYIGPASNDAQVADARGVATPVARETVGVQVSNISVTEDVAKTYVAVPVTAAASPVAAVAATDVAATPGASAAVDTNPKIEFFDATIGAGGSADGSVYRGPVFGIQDQYVYTGADEISLTAPLGASWEFGGGSGFTTLIALSGDNILLASSGGSAMTGGTGTDAFIVPDANLTGAGTADSITNFNVGDTVSLAGMAGPGWTYRWFAGSGGSGLTFIATSTLTPGLNELVTFTGLTLDDLSALTISPDASGNNALMITRENPQISSLDLNSGAAGSAVSTGANTTSDTVGIDAEYLYAGTNSMAFMAPPGENWEFGGGSAFTQLSATSGNNIFVASTGGSYMLGGSGDDRFEVPDANLTGAAVWDSITNFHGGDTLVLAGLAGPGWTYDWTDDFGSASNPALTLQANSTTTAGLSAFVTLNGLSMNSLNALVITHGTGADSGSLIVSR